MALQSAVYSHHESNQICIMHSGGCRTLMYAPLVGSVTSFEKMVLFSSGELRKVL